MIMRLISVSWYQNVDANAIENAAWLANPHRKDTDDMGRVYGV